MKTAEGPTWRNVRGPAMNSLATRVLDMESAKQQQGSSLMLQMSDTCSLSSSGASEPFIDNAAVHMGESSHPRHPDGSSDSGCTIRDAYCGPKKLYSREREQHKLLEAFRRALESVSNQEDSTATSDASRGGRNNLISANNKQSSKSHLSTSTREKASTKVTCRPSEFVLVTGISGSGKSSLVNSALYEECVNKHSGFLITAKFDQQDRPENYAPIVNAFTDLAEMVQTRDNETRQRFQRAVTEAIEKQPLLLDVIPALQKLMISESTTTTTKQEQSNNNIHIQHADQMVQREEGSLRENDHGSQAAASHNNNLCATATGALGQNTRQRLNFAFQTLVRALRSTQYPIVLCCDDLQWAEPASLDLLATIACDDDENVLAKGTLLVVGSCRHNEIKSASHPLSVMLRELEVHQVHINQIALPNNLDLDAVSKIVSNEYYFGDLRESDGIRYTCDKVADFVLRQTGGNPLFVVLLLRFLEEEGLLKEYDNIDSLEWERQVVESFNCTDSVQLLIHRLQRFDPQLREILRVAACLGAEFHKSLIAAIVLPVASGGAAAASGSNMIDDQLRLAEQQDLVQTVKPGVWRFTHDQVQLAAYSLVPEAERKQLHLNIGIKLWRNLPKEELELYAFVVITQLRLGAHLMTNQDDRNQMASFLLSSARAAVASSAFTAAASYVNLGINLLGDRHWRDEYQLSLALYNAAIEIEYCNGEYSKMDALTTELLKHAGRKEDTYLAVSNGVLASGIRGDFQKAIDMGTTMLRNDLGFSMPKNPGVPRMLWEFIKTKQLLKKYSDEDILNLPLMEDPGKLTAMRLMVVQFTYMININPILAIVASMKMVRTFLKHGIVSTAAPALSMFSIFLVEGFGEVALGVRLSRLSLKILDKFQSREWLPRTYFIVHGLTLPHVQPWGDSIKPLLVSHRVALAAGDFEYALHTAAIYMGISLATAVPLEQLWEDAKVFLVLGKAKQHAKIDHFVIPHAQFIANLMGQNPDPTVLTGAFMDEERELGLATEASKNTNVKILKLLKLRLLSYFHCYDEGETVAKFLMKQPTDDLGVFIKAQMYLHAGLLVTGAARRSKSASRARIMFVRRCLKRIKALAKTAKNDQCGMVLALEACVKYMQQLYDEADDKFNLALAVAKEQGLTHVIGIVNEHIADSKLIKCDYPEALEHLKNAKDAYKRWGAASKVQDLVEQMNEPFFQS